MAPTPEHLKELLRYKLGVGKAGPQDAERLQQTWQWVTARLREPRMLEQFVDGLLAPLAEIIGYGFLHHGREPGVNQARMQRWQHFKDFLKHQGELLNMLVHRAAEFLLQPDAAAPNATAAPPERPPAENVIMESKPEPGRTLSAWRYLPLPSEPDSHPESDAQEATIGPGLRLVGARVRGKKHKHEGTHCDDWFHFTAAGPWTLIAVADGAGSKKMSRVGARASCEAAIAQLASKLAATDPLSVDRAAAHTILQEAIVAGYDAVQTAFVERADKPEYSRLLGRKLELNDLSSTLLLAARAPLHDEDLILACQIGDGMTSVVWQDGNLQSLGVADSGGYSGETEFLTSRHKLEKEAFASRIFLARGRMQALMVMTDGVADDYFPNDPGLLQLYGDLVINRLLKLQPIEEARLAAALSKTRSPCRQQLHNLPVARWETNGEEIAAAGKRVVSTRSLQAFAEELELTLEELVKSPELLWLGGQGLPEEGQSAARLRTWLDNYHQRGSFDDRTLVVLHRETLA